MNPQQAATYYERYKKTDLVFSKEMIEVTGLIPKMVALKCMQEYSPCVIYSSSFEGAKIVASTKSGLISRLREANQTGTLKFCFNCAETGEPLTYYVAFRLIGYAPYGGSQETVTLHVQYINKPPDDLILIIGQILDADINASRRRGERILITSDVQRKLNLVSREVTVTIRDVQRQCILRDISFYGAKIVMMGSAKFLEDKEIILHLSFDEPQKDFALTGKFIRADTFEERKEFVAMAIAFDESAVPLGYKMRISKYISQLRHITEEQALATATS